MQGYTKYMFCYNHTRESTNLRPMPTNFYGLVGYDRVKKLPALIEERIYPRSTPAVSALYPWCTHAQIPLSPAYPVLPASQSPLCTTNPRSIPDTTSLTMLNIGPTPDLYAWFPLPASNE